MKKAKQFLFLIWAILFFVPFSAKAQEVVSVEQLGAYGKDFFLQYLDESQIFRDSVFGYRILYTTTNVEGQLDTVSGFLAVPWDGSAAVSTLIWCHGTAGSRYEVPAYDSDGKNIAIVMSSLDVVTLAPDYLGLGYDDGVHPYLHAETEARVGRDFYIAVFNWFDDYFADYDLHLNKEIFVAGYSQGGHVAMALHRDLEVNPLQLLTIFNEQPEVKGALPMSGPYDLYHSTRETIIGDTEYPLVAYLVNVALAYQYVYSNIFPQGDIANFFKPEYLPDILQFQNGEITLWELNQALVAKLNQNEGGAFAGRLIKDDVADAILSDPDHPVNVALRENDTYDWAPKAQTQLLYCEADDQVPYLNSLVARDTMIQRGATDVIAINLNPAFDHSQCAEPALIYLFQYLLQNRSIFYWAVRDDFKGKVSVYPTLVSDRVQVTLPEGLSGAHFELIDLYGRVLRHSALDGLRSEVALDVPPGMYFARVTDPATGRTFIAKLMVE